MAAKHLLRLIADKGSGKMKGLFRFGVTLSMVLSFYHATSYASRCTSEQMQKMAQGGSNRVRTLFTSVGNEADRVGPT